MAGLNILTRNIHSCFYCEESFSCVSSLKIHLKIHAGSKSFKCTKCQKVCSDPSTLRCHKLTHTDVKEYKCIICNETFS